jgi:hypothetical protein
MKAARGYDKAAIHQTFESPIVEKLTRSDQWVSVNFGILTSF